MLNLPSRTYTWMLGPLWKSIIYIINLNLEPFVLKGIANSSNYMVKHVLITPCGMQILQLDKILHLLGTLMDLIL